MRIATHRQRHAFSLLEMVLALALGMILLLALYVAFTTYIGEAQAGREVVAEATLGRNLLARMVSDIEGQVGPIDPRIAVYPGYTIGVSGQAASTSAAGASSGTTTPSTTTPTDVPTPVSYNVGVNGKTAGVLILSNHRIRKTPANADPTIPDQVPGSDIVLTAYWLVQNGADSAGLARAEIRQATSPDIDIANLDPNTLPDQSKYVFAPEVKSVSFQYFDGTNWADTWDGTVSPSTDGSQPPYGPPSAIKILITLKRNARRGQGPDDPGVDGPTYQQVVAIHAGNSFPQGSTP